MHAHTPFANCDVTYGLHKGTLFAERRLTVLAGKAQIPRQLPPPGADARLVRTGYVSCFNNQCELALGPQ